LKKHSIRSNCSPVERIAANWQDDGKSFCTDKLREILRRIPTRNGDAEILSFLARRLCTLNAQNGTPVGTENLPTDGIHFLVLRIEIPAKITPDHFLAGGWSIRACRTEIYFAYPSRLTGLR
jgi:hypothetical protein